MNPEIILTARKLRTDLEALAAIVDFRVFGSQARGDAGSDSDLDVFVEVESADDALKDRMRHAAWEIAFDSGIVISLLIFSRNELENTPLRSSPFVVNALSEGIAV
ncbi:MAG: nucleotidyltransferase domain-containing protein [Candidatus Wallbacteria bacterium]|nr:nucleotidyltransferase domain-containing protein [Candidatus Wallbacteria bacterium]